MDDVLRILAAFNWIDPVVGIAESAMRGEMGDTFTVADPSDCADAMALLRRNGIDVWGHGYDAWEDQWCFKVSKDDYERACQILKKHGWQSA